MSAGQQITAKEGNQTFVVCFLLCLHSTDFMMEIRPILNETDKMWC